jgi:uncharacterized protein GlcG (DUF336 family)
MPSSGSDIPRPMLGDEPIEAPPATTIATRTGDLQQGQPAPERAKFDGAVAHCGQSTHDPGQRPLRAARGVGELVDADGVQQAVLRGDRAGADTLESAFSKAFTAASFKTGTSALVERSKSNPVLANLFKLPNLLLLSGGIVIKVGDEVVGAIGAAGAPGGDLDDACAQAGLDKIKDQLK